MLKHHFTIAFRSLSRQKLFALVNVAGLAIGISGALIIYLLVHYEFSFDSFEPDAERIYRVVLDAKFSGNEGHSAGVPAPLGEAIAREVTGIEQTVPVFQFQGDATARVSLPSSGTSNPVVYKKQPAIIFTNPQYFSLLGYKWTAGSPDASMHDPFLVVLTESRAKQYFPSLPPAAVLGKRITYNDETFTTVSGIVKDLDENTAFTAREFISLATISQTNLQERFMMDVWNDWMAYSHLYVKLKSGIKSASTEAQLKVLLNKYNKSANKDADNTMSFHLQPLSDMHFNGDYPGVGERIARKATLYGLLAIAAFLLLLGCINFINLSTAQAARRAKEIGIRKTMGSSAEQLVIQFLGETALLTGAATVVSIALAPLLLHLFSDLTPAGLRFDLLRQPELSLFLLLLIITVTILAGLYPALVLSRYKPVLVLKNQVLHTDGQTRNAWIRKTLIVSQFVIAQFFVIATVMVSKQVGYALHADMGFDTDAIINFELPRGADAARGKQLLHDIKAIPSVAEASMGFFAPADQGVAFTRLVYNNGREELAPNTQIRWGDPEFIKVYNIKLLAGRNVQSSDSIKEFLVNESYAHAIGFRHADAAINRFINWNGKEVPIVGVMKDFHDQSFHSRIGPVVFGGSAGSTFHIKLNPDNASGTAWQNAIAKIQQAFTQLYPGEDFQYHFVDEKIAKLYENELRTARLLNWSSALAVTISLLGLLGLVTYVTNARRREISIRKVLGASVAGIVGALSAEFVKLVAIAFAIAAPLAWWAMYKWLQGFAYRTGMSWWVFAITAITAISIAFLTISIQAIKAALSNPVKSLRTE